MEDGSVADETVEQENLQEDDDSREPSATQGIPQVLKVRKKGAEHTKNPTIEKADKHQKGKKVKTVQEKNKYKRFEKHVFSFSPLSVEGLSEVVATSENEEKNEDKKEEKEEEKEQVKKKAEILLNKKQKVKGKKGVKNKERSERRKQRDEEMEQKRAELEEKEKEEMARRAKQMEERKKKERERETKKKQEEEAKLEEELLLSVVRI